MLPIVLMLVVPILMLFLRTWKPKFAYTWLIAVGAGILAWPMILITYITLPVEIPLADWQPQSLFLNSPTLRFDDYSWPFTLALSSLLLAVILSDVVRNAQTSELIEPRQSAEWSAWASSLFVTSLAIMAVSAGNLLTILLTWTAFDLTELLLRLRFTNDDKEVVQITRSFLSRVLSILIVAWASAEAISRGGSTEVNSLDQFTSVFLLLASGLRLGVLPLHLPMLISSSFRRSLGTLLRLSLAATGLIYIARTALSGVPEEFSLIMLILAGVAGIIGGILWVFSQNELDGRPYWLLAASAIVIFSAIIRQPAISLAWGINSLLSGGLIFLYSARQKRLAFLPVLGWLGLAGYAFAPILQSELISSGSNISFIIWGIIFITYVLLLTGYAKHALSPGQSLIGRERWVWFIYPLGLILLPITQLLLILWGRSEATELSQAFLEFPAMSTVFISFSLAIILIVLKNRLHGPSDRSLSLLKTMLSFNWLYKSLWAVFQTMERLIRLLDMILEGQGGILWTVLLLVLSISMLAYLFLGG